MKEINNCLNYPFDIESLIKKRKKIINHLLKNNNLKEIKIAVISGSTSNEIISYLEIFLLHKGFKPKFYQTNFDIYIENIINNDSNLIKFNPDIIYIYTSIKNILYEPEILENNINIKKNIKKELKTYTNTWKKIRNFSNAIIIQNNFELPYLRPLGSIDSLVDYGFTKYVITLNENLNNLIKKRDGILLCDVNYLSSYIGLENWFDSNLWYSYKIGISNLGSVNLANNISSIINSYLGKKIKALVLDLDNTLWGGVIGDDGIEKISIGNINAVGEVFRDFQQYLKKINKTGIILTVASKNEYENAIKGLKHNENVLKLEDFTQIESNWKSKDKNIISICKKLNINSESIVFIDDNPIERHLVRTGLKNVKVPEIGSDVTLYSKILDRSGLFEKIEITLEDFKKKEMYSQNQKRENIKSKIKDINKFLKSLQMKSSIQSIDKKNSTRTFQLINKTNQFNLTTKRMTDNDIYSISKNKNFISLTATLSDKFGENGLVIVLIAKIVEKNCYIENFLMSCRVFDRQLEFFLMNEFIEILKAKKINSVIGEYIRSDKNQIVENFYQKLNFRKIFFDKQKKDINYWILNIKDYKKIKTYIGKL